MRKLLAILLICIGCYALAYSCRLVLLRGDGYSAGFKVLDAITGYLPFVSAALLLMIGVFHLLSRSLRPVGSLLIKLAAVIVIALLPIMAHAALYCFTYTTGIPDSRTNLGHLSWIEWLILLAGGVLLPFGLYLSATQIRRN